MEEVAVAADGRSLTAGSDSHTSHSYSLFTNYPLAAALVSFALAQFLKILTTWYKEKRWDAKRLLGSGGMPSSHSATVTALAVSIGLQDGPGGSSFAVALVLACVVMYDAFGVRLHAGRQAEVLNQIVFELPAEHPLSDTRPLREPLGHTPPQDTLTFESVPFRFTVIHGIRWVNPRIMPFSTVKWSTIVSLNPKKLSDESTIKSCPQREGSHWSSKRQASHVRLPLNLFSSYINIF